MPSKMILQRRLRGVRHRELKAREQLARALVEHSAAEVAYMEGYTLARESRMYKTLDTVRRCRLLCRRCGDDVKRVERAMK